MRTMIGTDWDCDDGACNGDEDKDHKDDDNDADCDDDDDDDHHHGAVEDIKEALLTSIGLRMLAASNADPPPPALRTPIQVVERVLRLELRLGKVCRLVAD